MADKICPGVNDNIGVTMKRSQLAPNLVFDIGMFDAADTEYYLRTGARVIAVEANPALVTTASARLARDIDSGRLTLVHGAISDNGAPVKLTLCGQDLGSSSIYADRLVGRRPMGEVEVPGIRMSDLFNRYGVPDYLKVDIEGSDHICVKALSTQMRPKYLSFEVGQDDAELIGHAAACGYRGFKVINQVNFQPLQHQRALLPRLVQKVRRMVGGDPKRIWTPQGVFTSGHTSGPGPWCSAGSWVTGDEAIAAIRTARATGQLYQWYDVQACVP